MSLTANQALNRSLEKPQFSECVNNYIIAALELSIERSIYREDTELNRKFPDKFDNPKIIRYFEELGYKINITRSIHISWAKQ